ncbi:MAG: threonine ammonia-lyase [Pseudonocardia sp. SCN 73-27]|uniref:threonine ammonia-lyase n=1 Tax=unclassified Pseudonocardia TaxID=2619320 RepID=UPI00086C235A|nr:MULTISPECIES: threonine ammonia-lyase [unclassified Pseudonocardia]ODU04797.1 MAG: threonine ammonia-lyase [Pseudonocardia sp. SCN 72-51]ODV05642.1 MAG: threonine ammonia-lyase [Pseudonocardia sp. SCN 73-27]
MTANPRPTPPPVAIEDVEAARDLLVGVVRRTPTLSARALGEKVGGPVWLKCENQQRTGSFKIRGAYTRLARLDDDERARGVVAASAGNHAQGVALAARLLGVDATVFMPERAALPKVDATRGYGAHVRLVGETIDGSLAAATAFAAETGAVLVHPFDHVDVIAGQGTVGLEILEDVPDVATVLVPTGGGGLLGGVAAAIKGRRPDARIVGVQAEAAAAWPESLRHGGPVALDRMRTIADGIAVGVPGAVTYPQVAALVDEFVVVGEDALARALLHCLERAKVLVEPAGAAAVAALLENPDRFPTPAVAVLSGGNIDPLVLLHVIEHGMAAARRYLSMRVRVDDRPGALAELLTQVGDLGANVVDVEHTRISAAIPLGDVDVEISLETRGAEHCAAIVGALRNSGHAVFDVAGAPWGSAS